MVYIYALVDPLTNEVRYVGKSNNPRRRISSHSATKLKHGGKTQWFSELREKQLLPVVKILEEVGEDGWVEREQHWMDYYRRQGATLLNVQQAGSSGNGKKIKEWHRQNKDGGWLKMLRISAAERRGKPRSPKCRAVIQDG